MPIRQLRLVGLALASLLATVPAVAQTSRVLRVPFSEIPAQGLGLTFAVIDGNPYVVVAGYEAREGNNRWIYRVSTNLATKELGFGLPRTVEGVGWEAQGAGAAAANLDGNPRPELVLMAYDNPEGANTFRYRIGWNLDPSGQVTRWSHEIVAPGVGYEAQGAGIDIDQIDDDPRPDLVVGAYDSTPEGDDFFYRIGFNLGPDGVASSWSDRKQAPGLGWEADGMGLEVVRFDGKPHLLLMVYDDPPGMNEFRYRLGIELGADGNVARWSRPNRLLGVGELGEGAGIAVYDGPARGDLASYSAVVAALDPNPRGLDREARLYQWRLAGTEGEPESVLAFAEHLPTCSEAALDEARFIETQMQGASYTDGRGSWIGRYAAQKRPTSIWGDNWYPVDQHRHALCGELHHYNFFIPPIDVGDDEADFNNFFLPGRPFAHLIADTLQPDLSDWHQCGSAFCMEGEVTPAWAFQNNLWFPMNEKEDTSPLEGREICTYGPWVTEEAHNNRPEIHPSEAYWWREDEDRWTMLLLRDNSRRFSQPDYFSEDAGRDPLWRPWARRPLWGTFRVPFSATLDRDGIFDLSFYAQLQPALTGGVVTATLEDAGQDAAAGTAHVLRVDGQPVVLVHEIQVRDVEDPDLGVGFSGLCLAEDRTRLHGFLELTAGVLEDDGGAGRATLTLRRNQGAEAFMEEAAPSSKTVLSTPSRRSEDQSGKQALRIRPAVASRRVDRYPAAGRTLPFARRLGLASSTLPPGLQLKPLRSVDLELQPLYVRRKEAVRTEKPFSASWTVTLEDLQTGTREKVSVAAARERGIALDLPGSPGEKPLRVSFAPDLPPTRVILEARLADSLSNEGTYKQNLWSHVIEGPADLEAFARASLALVQPDLKDETLREAMSPGQAIPLDPRRDMHRSVRVLATYAGRAVMDGALDPGELERLGQLAGRKTSPEN